MEYNKIDMDPESAGRCRRTDGRKWRCSKDVVKDQKYCERHMHRGRNRSRKHVEVPSIPLNSNSNSNSKTLTKTTKSSKTKTALGPKIIRRKINSESDNYTTYLNNRNSDDVSSHIQEIVSSPANELRGGYKSSLVNHIEQKELQRCRRTDGKSSQYNEANVLDEKNCFGHLYEGAKKMEIRVASCSVQPPPLSVPKKETENSE